MSPVLIGVLGVVGAAMIASTASVVAMAVKAAGFLDSKVKNENLRGAMDLGLHVAGAVAQAAYTTVATDLSTGNVAKVLPDLVTQVKAIATAQGGAAANQLLTMGETYLNTLVQGALAKLAPAAAAPKAA